MLLNEIPVYHFAPVIGWCWFMILLSWEFQKNALEVLKSDREVVEKENTNKAIWLGKEDRCWISESNFNIMETKAKVWSTDYWSSQGGKGSGGQSHLLEKQNIRRREVNSV